MQKNLKIMLFCADTQKLFFTKKVKILLNKKRWKTVGYKLKCVKILPTFALPTIAANSNSQC